MNLSQRGIENILLRRVRRHQSMTTLFRAPDTDPARLLPQPGRSAVAQSSLHSLGVPATPDSVDSSVRSAAPVPAVVARQVVSAPASVKVSTDSRPPAPVASTVASGGPDPVWNQLQAIFRKHQERANADTFNPLDSETFEPGTVQPATENVPRSPDEQKPQYGLSQSLETIFRRHQERANADTFNAPDTATSEPGPVQPATANAPRDPDERKPQHGLSQSLGTIFRKHQERANADTFNAPDSGTLQPATDEVPRGPNERKPEHELSQDPETISHKPQEQAQPKPLDIPTLAMPETESFAAVDPTAHDDNQPNWKQGLWHGLRTIFRKYQEQAGSKTLGKPTAATPVEPTEPDPIRQPNDTKSPGGVVETRSADRPYLPFQSPALPTASTERVQRSTENADNESQADVSKVIGKNQTLLSLPPHQEHPVQAEAMNEPSGGQFPEETAATPDQAPATHYLQRQPSPLESVWKVQRLEAPESHVPDSSPEVHNAQSLTWNGPVGDEESEAETQPTIFREAAAYPTKQDELLPTETFDSSRTPVEILPPSRPRPMGASVMPSPSVVQKLSENKDPAAGIKETPLVNTAIGPLPSDLWSLLGQKPPVSSRQPEAHGETPVSFGREQPSNAERTITSQHTLVPQEGSIQAPEFPSTVQRQTLPNELSMPASQETDHSLQTEEPTQAEPDIEDLAHKVYAEIRRRLATERERIRWK